MQKLPEGKKRNANMELLRLVAMMMVTMLHALGKSGSLHPINSALPLNGWVAWALETLSVCAVDVFMLLSGYFMIHSKFKLRRLLELVLQTLFYSLVPLGIFICMGLVPREELDVYHILQYCLPIHMEVFWFITAYVVLYMVSPILSEGINAMEEKPLRCVILCLLVYECVFKSVLPMKLVTDTEGYHFLWYLIMFLIGAYFRRFGFKLLTSTSRGVVVYLLGCALIFMETCIVYWINAKFGRLNDLLMVSYHYNQIFVILSSVGIFTAFLHAKPIEGRLGRAICLISPYALGVYLLQENLQLRFTWQGWFGLHAESLSEPMAVFLLRLLLAVVSMFVFGIIVDAIRAKVFQGIAMIWGRRKE
jgi:surface polysaccharide O-acyltransferase-like enzyme